MRCGATGRWRAWCRLPRNDTRRPIAPFRDNHCAIQGQLAVARTLRERIGLPQTPPSASKKLLAFCLHLCAGPRALANFAGAIDLNEPYSSGSDLEASALASSMRAQIAAYNRAHPNAQ